MALPFGLFLHALPPRPPWVCSNSGDVTVMEAGPVFWSGPAGVASSGLFPSRTSGDIPGAQLLRPPCCFVDEEKARQDPSYYLKNTNAETRETLQELYKEFKGDEVLAATMKVPEKKKVDKLNAVSRWWSVQLPAQATRPAER